MNTNTSEWPDSAVEEAGEVLNDMLSECDAPVAISEKGAYNFMVEYWLLKFKWFLEKLTLAMAAIVLGFVIIKSDPDWFRFTIVIKGILLIGELLLLSNYFKMHELKRKLECVGILDALVEKHPEDFRVDDISNEDEEDSKDE